MAFRSQRDKRPTQGLSGVGSAGGGSKGGGGGLGNALFGSSPDKASMPSGDDYSGASQMASLKGDDSAASNFDDVAANTTATNGGDSSISALQNPYGQAPGFWDRLKNTPYNQSYNQYNLSTALAANQLANQQQMAMFNAQTVDPILQGNTTAALLTRAQNQAPIQVQIDNARRLGVDYNDWNSVRQGQLTTALGAQQKDQALDKALTANYVNDQMRALATRPNIGALVSSGDNATVANNNYSTALNTGRLPFATDLGASQTQLGISQNQLENTRAKQDNAWYAANPNYSGDVRTTALNKDKMQVNRMGDINAPPGTSILQYSPDNQWLRTIQMPGLGFDLNGAQNGNFRRTVGQPIVTEAPKPIQINNASKFASTPSTPQQAPTIGQQADSMSTATPSNQDVINSIQNYLNQQSRRPYMVPLSTPYPNIQ